VDPQIIDHGDTVEKPINPTRTGYTFEGWYRESAYVNAWNFATDIVTSDTTLYAKWTINSYTITFNSNGGSAVASQTIEHGQKVTQPTPPTRTGFTFEGWFRENTHVNVWNFATDTVIANITLFAKWNDATSIADILETNTKIYPNPFSDILHITDAEGYTLRIMTQTGIIVHTQRITNSVETVNLQHLSAGVYILQLQKDGEIKATRIVKQ